MPIQNRRSFLKLSALAGAFSTNSLFHQAHAEEWQPDVPFAAAIHFDATVPTLLSSCDGADLLVVGSSGHGSHRHIVLGSVADQCSHHARCPVAVIR